MPCTAALREGGQGYQARHHVYLSARVAAGLYGSVLAVRKKKPPGSLDPAALQSRETEVAYVDGAALEEFLAGYSDFSDQEA